MRGVLRRAVPALALLCLLLPAGACDSEGSSQGQRNDKGDNFACMGQNNQCVNGPLIVSSPPSTASSSTASASSSASPSATTPPPEDSPSPPRTPSPTSPNDDGDTRPDDSGATARLDRAPRAVLRGPGVDSLRVALVDVHAPQPRWHTLGIGARHLRAAGVGGVLFRLRLSVPASVTVDTSRAPTDVEYAFFDGDGWYLGTQTAASCATLCPSLTQNLVAAPQYQHLLVTDPGRSTGWLQGQRYMYTDVTG
ncbi:hypothetical protein RB200_29455 [Streptomyces sp. PmtG]